MKINIVPQEEGVLILAGIFPYHWSWGWTASICSAIFNLLIIKIKYLTPICFKLRQSNREISICNLIWMYPRGNCIICITC